MRTAMCFVLLAGVVCAAGCRHGLTPSRVAAPGEEKTPRTKVLEAGAAVLQDTTPVDRANVYVRGFHFVNGDMNEQMEAHHYCTPLNEDFMQCVLYDGNGKDAKLIGIEYIVSAKLFDTLPEEEKRLWHSHVHEVKSGTLVAPGLPQAAEHELMEKIVGTYGKTWHTWNTHRGDALPLGAPHLMMAFTADGQLRPGLVEDRDRRLNLSTEKARANRADIAAPPVAAGADAWQQGDVLQVDLKRVPAGELSTRH